MDIELIANLVLAAIQVANEVIPALKSDDAATLSAALQKLNAQVDQLHANVGGVEP